MKKRFLVVIFFMLFFNISVVFGDKVVVNDKSIYSNPDISLKGKNIILYNLDDDVILYEKNSDLKVQIASLTKIMTVYTLIENVKDLNKEVVITGDIFNGISDYSQAGLRVGDKVTYMDLLYGIMLPSGADCVNAAIKNLGVSKEEFINLMNNVAKKMGLTNTKFDNAVGMDSKNNYSTAKEVAIMLKKALANDIFKKVYTAKKYTMSNGLNIKSTLLIYGRAFNTNNFLGAKSGYTDGAGVCLSSIAKYGDVNYLLIVLGASSVLRSNAVLDSVKIYDYYNNNYSYRNVVSKNKIIKKLDVKWGKQKKYSVKANKDIEMYLDNSLDLNKVKYQYKGLEEIKYNNKKGEKLGKVLIKYEDKLLTEFDVYLDKKLEFYHPVLYTILFLIFLCILLIILKIRKKRKKRKKRKRKKKRK